MEVELAKDSQGVEAGTCSNGFCKFGDTDFVVHANDAWPYLTLRVINISWLL